MSVAVDPYIFFKGNAREAMEFYKHIFGGDLVTQTYAEVNMPPTEGLSHDSLMHASLEGGHAKLMASDTAQASPVAAKISISLSGTDEETLRGIFDKLSEGVEVKYPLKKEFWGDTFGSVTDKYGVEWMINITGKPA
ncbi:MAG: VOC family protein [Candidatus Saccharimonadales bacterium]